MQACSGIHSPETWTTNNQAGETKTAIFRRSWTRADVNTTPRHSTPGKRNPLPHYYCCSLGHTTTTTLIYVPPPYLTHEGLVVAVLVVLGEHHPRELVRLVDDYAVPFLRGNGSEKQARVFVSADQVHLGTNNVRTYVPACLSGQTVYPTGNTIRSDPN